MADATSEFFQQLGRRGHEPFLEKANGTLRFDLTGGKRTSHWLVNIRKGDVTVSRGRGEADCALRVDQEVFSDIVVGKVNAMAAVLRGVLMVDGDAQLLVLFQRLFAGPSDAGQMGKPAGYAKRLP